MSDVTVKLDERVRLMSALLAATTYPEKAQKLQPHGTHAHARATLKFLREHQEHPAVEATQGLVDQNTPMEALFQLVMSMSWPGLAIDELPGWAPKDFNVHMQDFYEKSGIGEWWEKEDLPWNKALREATDVFKTTEFKEFLVPFLGKTDLNFVFIPNISYPANYDIAFKLGSDLICVAPPPLAWGDSPPWPYNESSMLTYTIRAALTVYGRILLKDYLHAHPDELSEAMKTDMPVSDQFRAQHPGWEAQFSALFLSGIVAMYLEAHIDEAEYKAYMLMQKKARGMAMLPGTVSVLRRYLQEVGGGKYENFMQFLPIFPKQLRVAKRIVTF